MLKNQNEVIAYLKSKSSEKKFYDINKVLKDNNLPTPYEIIKMLNCKTWSDVSVLCGFRCITCAENIFTGDEVLIYWFNKLGRQPTPKEFKKFEIHPSYNWYRKYYESLENACYLLGLIEEKRLSVDIKFHNSIAFLQDLAKQLNCTPTREQYDSNRDINKTLCFAIFIDKTNCKNMKDLYNKYIPQYDLSRLHWYDEKDLKNEIISVFNTYEVQQFKDLTNYGITISSAQFRRRFGNYSDFVRSIGFTPIQNRNNDDKNKIYRDFIQVCKQINRIPTYKEMFDFGLASTHKYTRKFGSMENLYNLVKIDYPQFSFSDNITGRVLYNKNNDKCRSIEECKISNLFVDNGIEYIIEPSYKELIPNDRRLFDWKIKINNEWYYIEYFGIYQKNNKHKGIVSRYVKKTRKKIKDLYKKDVIKKCVFVFPNNYNTLVTFLQKYLQRDIDIHSLHECYSKNTITDEELVEKLMIFSTKKNTLPSYNVLAETKNLSLYNEVKSRYGNYETFGKKCNLKTAKYNKSTNKYRKIDLIFIAFDEMINQYGRILTAKDNVELTENYYGLKMIYSEKGIINLKIEYAEHCINNNKQINEVLINELNLVLYKGFPYNTSAIQKKYGDKIKDFFIKYPSCLRGDETICQHV